MRIFLPAMVAGIATVVLVAGCGGSSGSASSGSAAATTAGSSASQSAPSPAPATVPTTTTTASPASSTGATSTSSSGSTTVKISIPSLTKSISQWVSCSGTADDAEGVAIAFAAAKGGAFTLLVDCPVRLKIGTDIARTIFIEDNTAVQFSGNGKFIVDNVLHPAFAMVNASNITLLNWEVEFDGSLPVNPNLGGYINNGQHMSVATGTTQPAHAFSDLTLTSYLAQHRGVRFDQSQGPVNARWTSPTNLCAVFYLAGDTSNVTVSGLHLYVPAGVPGSNFIPVAFASDPNFKSNQTVTAKTVATGAHLGVPRDLAFSNIILDGTYMGWVGNMQNARFQDVTSHRYGDLQDAQGHNVGGVGKWFAPPHLFYISNGSDTDETMFNTNIDINGVVDDGPRVGVARDKGGSDSISGYATSLKLGCNSCTVDTYTSSRPDGFMDVLPSDGLSVSNATATYDSSFTNNMYPGWRFPGATAYKNVTFQNVSITDTATVSTQGPVGNAPQAGNGGFVFDNVHVSMKNWGRDTSPVPTIVGDGNTVTLDYRIGNSVAYQWSQNGDISVVLKVTPFNPHAGATSAVSWLARNATSCSAGGFTGFSGGVGASSSKSVRFTSTGSAVLTIDCRNSSQSTSAAVQVTIQ